MTAISDIRPNSTSTRAAQGTTTSAPQRLLAEVGDILVIDQGGMSRIPRVGEIVAILSADGSPPYRVRWLAGEYESKIRPGPGARIEKRCRTATSGRDRASLR